MMKHQSTLIGMIAVLWSLLPGPGAIPVTAAGLNLDETGVALGGYDPVSYHTGNPVKGGEEFSFVHDGARYLFAGPDTRAAFEASPETYRPAFGGWCAWAMLDGEKVKVDPETYKIVDGRTYLFYHSFFINTLNKWNELADEESEAVLIDRARQSWQKLGGEGR